MMMIDETVVERLDNARAARAEAGERLVAAQQAAVDALRYGAGSTLSTWHYTVLDRLASTPDPMRMCDIDERCRAGGGYRTEVNRLVQRGLIERVGHGIYRVAHPAQWPQTVEAAAGTGDTVVERLIEWLCGRGEAADAVTIHEALFAGKRLHSTRTLLIRLYGVGVLDRPQRGMYVVADALRDDSTGADLWDLVADGYSTIDDIMAHASLSRSDVSYGLSVLALAGHLRRVCHGVYEVAS